MMPIICASLSHHNFTISQLELLSIDNLSKHVGRLRTTGVITEAIVLHTCHRVEIYAVAKDIGFYPEKMISQIENQVSLDQFTPLISHYQNIDAIEHIFRVACGLESMILGENEILGQVRSALKIAEESKSVGPILRVIFQKAVETGKRVRRDTEIAAGNVSIGSVAVNYIHKSLGRSLRRVTVIGAGDVAVLVGKSLTELAPEKVVWLNRTLARAKSLADQFSAEAQVYSPESLAEALDLSDVLILATGCPKRLITVDRFRELQRQSNLLLVDLGNPRNVSPEVESLDKIAVVDLDHLKSTSEEATQRRKAAIPIVEDVIEHRIDDLLADLRRLWAEPLISSIFKAAEDVRRDQLEKTIPRLDIRPEKIQILEVMTSAIVKQTLHTPIRELRQRIPLMTMGEVDWLLSLFSVPQEERTFSQDDWRNLVGLPDISRPCKKRHSCPLDINFLSKDANLVTFSSLEQEKA